MKRSLRSWLWSVPLDQEVDEELAFHIEMRTREFMAQGMDPKAAREAALRRVGDLRRLKGTCIDLGRKRDREMRLTQRLEEFRDDVKFAIRQLRDSPGFTCVAALTLALGIGANSAMFALADATLLRPLPYREAERLVLIEEHGPEQAGRSRIDLLNFGEWASQSRTFEAMAAIWVVPGGGGPTMTGADGTPETVPAQSVTPQFFDVLGVKPLLGRLFLPADESLDPDVVVVSEGFWRNRFAANPDVVGRPITLDGRPSTIIGIVPATFRSMSLLTFATSDATDIWRLLPLPRDAPAGGARGQCAVCRFLQVIGRMKPGVSIEAAHADISGLAEALAERNGARRPRRITITSLRDAVIGRDLRLSSLLFLGVGGFVLLLCCANIANLILARATVRTRELAVRTALGAGRRRIVAQLLTESLVLAVLAALLGAGIGAAFLQAAPAVLPAGLLPHAVTLAFDGQVVIFCAVVALLVGLLCGVAPAWHVTGASLVQAIASESRGASGTGTRLRSALVAAEVAVAVLVLCGAGLLLRTLFALEGVEPGHRVQRDRVLAVTISAGSRYPDGASLLRFHEAVAREVATVPGVQDAAWATALPLGGSQLGRQAFTIAGEELGPDEARPQADHQIVSASYFQTLDLPIVAGRAFTDHDRSDATPVCIVNEAFVARYLRGRNPLGVRIALPPPGQPPIEREIVGVARQIKGRPDETEAFIQIYVPNAQTRWPDANLIVRATAGDAAALAPAVRQAVARVDKLLPVGRFVTLDELAGIATARPRFRTTLVGAFAAMALLLAMVGVFGVLAYSVQQRWREFAVRIALGASPRSVLGLVAGSAARVIAAGAAIGLAGAAGLSQLLSTFLFGVEPLDPVTFASVVMVLTVTAAIAAAGPALRATRVDPAATFRND